MRVWTHLICKICYIKVKCFCNTSKLLGHIISQHAKDEKMLKKLNVCLCSPADYRLIALLKDKRRSKTQSFVLKKSCFKVLTSVTKEEKVKTDTAALDNNTGGRENMDIVKM